MVYKMPDPRARWMSEATNEPIPAMMYRTKLLQAVTDAPFLRKQSIK